MHMAFMEFPSSSPSSSPPFLRVLDFLDPCMDCSPREDFFRRDIIIEP